MLRFTIIVILLLSSFTITAQVMEGVLLDKESLDPVIGAVIINTHTGINTSSDTEGHYRIQANSGDTLLFRHVAYHLYEEVMVFTIGSRFKSILMQPLIYTLKETVIKSRTKYQQDSLDKQAVYNHELNKTLVPKPKYTGLGCAGCIGWLADKITGNSKGDKKFRKEFAAEDRNNFTDSRYTPELVASLTPLKNEDSIAAFIYTYPMDNDFARAASDLELKSWIRKNYKQYTGNH